MFAKCVLDLAAQAESTLDRNTHTCAKTKRKKVHFVNKLFLRETEKRRED
jgi:hypothetical protein